MERLRQAIIDAEIPLGSELSEQAVAESLGVSRTPVREALSQLQQQGLVVIVPQKGSYVFFPTEQDIIDLCEYRVMIENTAISFAFTRDRNKTLQQLQQATTDMGEARTAKDVVAYARADTDFHEAFIANAGNRYLQTSYSVVAGPISTLRSHLSIPLEGAQERSFGQHKLITELFESGNISAITPILTEHILSTRRSYILALQEGLIENPREQQ